MKKVFLMILALTFCFGLKAQTKNEQFKKNKVKSPFEIKYNKQYNRNIKKSKIDGVFIPKDLEEAFQELIALSPSTSLVSFKEGNEEEVARKLHFGIGKWMIINWNFEMGSRFSHCLKQKGLSFPDDMAQFVLRTFHRHLNNKKLDEQLLIDYYVDKRKKEQEERKKNRKVIKTEIKPIPRDQ